MGVLGSARRARTLSLIRWAAGAAATLLGLGASCWLLSNAALAATMHQRQLFSPGSYLNARLGSHAPIDRHSPRMVSGLVDEVTAELADHRGPWINAAEYSTPIYTVRPGQSRVRVKLDRNLPEMQRAISAVPIPRRARPATGGDKQMAVWQPATDTMWEFWRMRRGHDGWHAGAAGAMRHVSTNPGYYTAGSWPGVRPWWGATATGLPLLGGLMTIRELLSGQIDHALAIGVPDPRAGVWSTPATHADGVSKRRRALPEGARLRLDPRLDLGKLDLPPITRMMAEAAQQYGIVVRDRSGVVAFYAEDPSPLRRNPYPRIYGGQYPNQILARFPWRYLQVLRLHLRHAERP